MPNATKFRALTLIALTLVLFVPAVMAQGGRFNDVIFQQPGVPAGGSFIRVCTLAATGTPCSPTASIYNDVGLTAPAANPITADINGNFGFWAAPGNYQLQVSRGTASYSYDVTVGAGDGGVTRNGNLASGKLAYGGTNGTTDVKTDSVAGTDGSGNLLGASFGTSGANGGIQFTEGNCSSLIPTVGVDLLCGNASTHVIQISNNGAAFAALATTGPAGSVNSLQINLGGGVFGAAHMDDGATTAGTITSTEQIVVPDGNCTTPGLGFATQPDLGFIRNTTNTLVVCGAGEKLYTIASGGDVGMEKNAVIGFSDTGNNSTTTKTASVSQVGPGVIGIGTGARASVDGIIESSNAGTKLTSDYTNATTTPSAVWTSVALTNNKPWTLTCDGAYQTSNNTTGTLLLAVNFQVAPVNAAMTAQIWTTNTNTATSATVAAISSSGNSTILTGAAENATGTNYQFRLYGSFEQNAGATGTVALMAAAGGTGTITIPRDSIVCRVF